MTALVMGPTMAIQNSDLASGDSDSICETPPSANKVMARTFSPRDFATTEWASSWNRRVMKKRTDVMPAVNQMSAGLQPALKL